MINYPLAMAERGPKLSHLFADWAPVNGRLPDLQMCCRDLTTRSDTGILAPAMTTGRHTLLTFY